VLYAVRMDVSIPDTVEPEARSALLAEERNYCQTLQRDGRWLEIWRIAGRYSNLSIFDVADNEELHEILWNLPLFPYMTITIDPLAGHPSRLPAG